MSVIRKESELKECGEVISLIFCDTGESHVGMERIGTMAKSGQGFHLKDFSKYKKKFEKKGYKCELHNLNALYANDSSIKEIEKCKIEDAHVLVVRNATDYFLRKKGKTSVDLYNELNGFEWDQQYYCTRRKTVFNKRSRTYVCFGEKDREPKFEEKKGRVVGYDRVKCVKYTRKKLEKLLGKKGEELACEGHRYFDLKKCGIGWHGDTGRRIVVAFRLGETMDLHFHWFYKSKPFGDTLKIKLDNGDLFMMSEKAVGSDWKSRNGSTLPHAAGKAGCKHLKLK